jgi:uncharacterized protein with ParB-like and HNH nuclease domain
LVNWREYKNYLDENRELNIKKMLENGILPLNVLKDQKTYFKYRYYDLVNLFDEKQLQTIDKYMDNLIDYHVLTLNLDFSYNEKPDEIIILFERINKTGVRLSTYDLLNARFYKFIKLREEWEKVFENYPNIRKYAVRVDKTDVPYSFIQALALANHHSIKSKDLIIIDERILNKENWYRVVDLVKNKVLATLNQIYRCGSSKYKGVFNLIFMNNALDFFEPENYHLIC